MFLQLLAYVGIVTGFIFLTLAIASGLYYISELVEEHTVPTKKFLIRSIYTIISIYILLLIFDGFPWLLTCFSIGTYFVYLQNLNKFPFINLRGPIFITSCILVVINHYLWFNYFSNIKQNKFDNRRIVSFAEVSSFFGICIWFIPFALFVSLSATDNILPTSTNNKFDSDSGKKKSQGLARVIIGNLSKVLFRITRSFGYELDPNYGRIV